MQVIKNPKPNTVFGLKTPGSTALTMDDGSVDDNGFVHPNQIRLQTGSGASVILDGTNDLIYMINSTGSGLDRNWFWWRSNDICTGFYEYENRKRFQLTCRPKY